MSTTPEQDGTTRRLPDQTSRLQLPSFAPLRPSSVDHSNHAESSASGSHQSRSNESINGEQEHLHDNISVDSSLKDSIRNGDVDEPKQHRSRGSGGFLIDSLSPSLRLSRNLGLGSHKDSKGKRKGDDAQLSIPKRRSKAIQAQQRMSIGSSPLATEFKNDPDQSEPKAPSMDGSSSGPHVKFPGSGDEHSEPGIDDRVSSTASPQFRNIGFDTDSAQIVRMALSLSEGRRRQASEKRILSGTMQRSASGRVPNQPKADLRPASIGQYLGPARNASGRGSPAYEPKPPFSSPSATIPEPFVDTQEATDDFMDITGASELSRATSTRVQKAKTYFELAYENRRLLSHLPPLRRPGASAKHPDLETNSRTYNPLQYVRNRKLRIWEKSTINGEAEGWHDIELVRTWVDAVVNSHAETKHDPNEIVRLPELNQASASPFEDPGDLVEKSPRPRAHDKQRPKPMRPRSDWVTHPGDLIADAFWLEQGLNKTKIQDKDGNHIYDPHTEFNFSGWRTRTPAVAPLQVQPRTPPPDDRDALHPQSPPQSALPELPTFTSADDRQKVRKRLHKQPINRAVDRKTRRHFQDFGISSDSELSHTDDVSSSRGDSRGRKRLLRRRELYDLNGGKTAKLIESNSDRSRDGRRQLKASPDESTPTSAQSSKRTSVDLARFSRFLKRDDDRSASAFRRSHSRPTSQKPLGRERTASTMDGERVIRTSAEYDTTAPNSPVVPAYPSITINLSPPPSRSPSPHKKSVVSKLNPFRDRSNKQQDHDDADITESLSKSVSQEPTSAIENKSDRPFHDSRGTSPMTKGVDPLAKGRRRSSAGEEFLPPIVNHDHKDSISRASTRSAAPSQKDEHNHRIRAIFKGGRIAEIVGHEVSRVGDFIWKRDPPNQGRTRHSASTSSLRSWHSDDAEDDRGEPDPLDRTPQQRKQEDSSPFSSPNEHPTSTPSTRSGPGSEERPQYHNSNLPSFVSPFQRDREKQEERKAFDATPGQSQDHMSHLSAQHRASKSPRLGELPRLIMPDGQSPDVGRDGRGFNKGLERSRSASNLFNRAITDNTAGGLGLGLRPTRSHIDLVRTLSPSRSERGEAPLDTATALRKDISRVEVLLLSSAVKAREIVTRADAIRQPDAIPPIILETLSHGHSSPVTRRNSIRRREEHIFAARSMINTLTQQATEFNHKLRSFSDTLVPSLHRELQILEDMVENTLTPKVRATADEAGELSMKLTTTSTLAVKGINDAIESALRRRRHGPIRWVRRVGYQLIEWLVVAVLWWIWLVVTIVREVVGVGKRVAKGVRWLLWLD